MAAALLAWLCIVVGQAAKTGTSGRGRTVDGHPAKCQTVSEEYEVIFVSYTTDGKNLVTITSDGAVAVLCGRTHRVLMSSPVPDIASWSTALSWGASSSRRPIVRPVRLNQVRRPDGTPGLSIGGIGYMVKSFGLAPDGERVVAAEVEYGPLRNRVKVLSASAPQPLTGPKSMDHGWDAAGFSPEGERVVTTHRSRKHAAVWNATTGERIAYYKGSHRIMSFDWSPDGSRVAFGTYGDRGARAIVIDPSTAEEILSIDEEMGDAAEGVAFSGDGKRLATWSDQFSRGGTVRNATSCAAITTWRNGERHLCTGVNPGMHSVALSHDGKTVVTAGSRVSRGGGQVCFWPVRD